MGLEKAFGNLKEPHSLVAATFSSPQPQSWSSFRLCSTAEGLLCVHSGSGDPDGRVGPKGSEQAECMGMKSGGSSLPPPISLSWSHPLWFKDYFSFSHPQMPGIFNSTRQALREVIHACSQRRRLRGFWTNFYSNPYFSLLSTTISSKSIDLGPEARKGIAWLVHYIISENF